MDEFEKPPIAVNHFGVVVVQGVEVFVDRVCWKLVLDAQFEVKVGCCTCLQDQVWFGIWHGLLCDVPHPTRPRAFDVVFVCAAITLQEREAGLFDQRVVPCIVVDYRG